MRKRLFKRIASVGFVLLTISSMGSMSSAEDSSKMTAECTSQNNSQMYIEYLPIDRELLESGLMKENSTIDELHQPIEITYLPIDDDFKRREDIKVSISETKQNVNNAKGTTQPTQSWRFDLEGDCDGGGQSLYDDIYSDYTFVCNSNNQLHISGSVFLRKEKNLDLDIEFWDASTNPQTVTHIYIEPEVYTGSNPNYKTAYYFNFLIGPLSTSHNHYLKFNHVHSYVFEYFYNHVSYHVSHT